MANETTSESVGNGIYPYKPNELGPIVAAVLFGISAVLHLVVMIRKKTWFYSALVTGAFMMTLGYLARFLSSKSPTSLGLYIAQSLFIILPPSLYAATLYMIFGRLVLLVNAPQASLIRPTRVTKVFVLGDVVSFFMQAGGGGTMATAGLTDLGQKMMLIGLFVQLLFFGFFIFIALVLWKRMRASPAYFTTPRYGKHPWQLLLKLLLGAAAVVVLRCVFRVFEFAQGHDGYLANHEVWMYVFDATPMLAVQVSFHFVHAGNVFPRGFVPAKSAEEGSFVELHSRI